MLSTSTKSKFNQILATIVVTTGIFGLGTVLAWSSPALPNMLEDKSGVFANITIHQQSWISSIATLGALAACPVAGFSVEMFGRKRTMLFYSIPFTLAWIVIGFSTSVVMMCVGRFISGFCGGVFSLSAPVYIGETVESHIRGMLMNSFQLMLVTGILFTYIIGTFVSWQTLTLISSCVPLIFVILCPLIPESPRYLMSKGRYADAQKSLCWLRGTDDKNIGHIENELAVVQTSVEEGNGESARLRDLLKPSVLKPLAISLSLMVLEQASAFNVVIFYCVEIFTAAGTSIDSHLSSIIVAVVQVAATIMGTFLVDRAGRRILLIFSEAVMGLSFVALGAFFYIKKMHDGNAPHHLGWLPLVSVLLFIVAFSVGIGPLSWTIMGEILHPNVKGLCSAIATTLVWFSAFVVTKIYQSLVEAVGIDWSFWIFSSVSLIGAFIVYFFVPETKGKTLDEIQQLFTKPKKSAVPVPLAVYIGDHDSIDSSLSHSYNDSVFPRR